MQHIYNLEHAVLEQPSVVTIGVFDGVHRGHQHLIRQLVDEAHRNGQQAVIITFFPHPDIVLRGLEGRYYLTTPEQKAALFGELGVDVVVTQSFDADFRQIRAAAFVDSLLNQLKMASLWVGSDFAMGYKREGNVPFLQAEAAQKGFEVKVLDLVALDGGGAISSTAIREALQSGDVALAKAWLGRAYAVSGEVVHGEKRGRQIGFPTANVAVWEQQVIPGNGVYAGWAMLGNERHMAVTNVGVRPTFAGQGVTVESYLLDFDRDIYGQQLTVTFETKLRSEMKFPGIQALIEQINADVVAGREYLTQQSVTSE